MKPSWEWNEHDLRSIINSRVRESLTLDYKACDALHRSDKKIMELSKDVSSFANSAGGTIVYGIVEDKNTPTDFDAAYDPNGVITKDWLDQVIASNTHQRIDGIRINPVELTIERPGRLVFVVAIPQSARAPHMAKDHRYYKRHEFQALPMEDYEVRDVSRRQDSADLEVGLSISRLLPSVAILNVDLSNNASRTATHGLVGLLIDKRLTVLNWGRFGLQVSRPFAELNTTHLQTLVAPYGASPEDIPIWKGPTFHFSQVHLALPQASVDYSLITCVSTPGSGDKFRAYTLVVRNGQVQMVGPR